MKFDTPHFDKPWKLSLEDHYQTPDTLELAAKYATGSKEAWQRLSSNLLDFTKQRIEQMDQTGVELSILSLAPGVEGIYDKKRAVQVARRSNDVVADAMANNPDRFRSFAALPMQDPDEAIKELHRSIKELGFVGALICGFSQIGEEDTSYYLDIPMLYQQFWAEVEKLDVPVYLHPREPLPSQQQSHRGHPWLLGAAWAFGVETATTALPPDRRRRDFDEHPSLRIILGHLGEALPFSIWRVEHRNVVDPRGLTLKKKFSRYFYENFYVTTSGNFRTQAAHQHHS